MDFSSSLPSSASQSVTPFQGGGSCCWTPSPHQEGRLLPPILPVPWERSPSPCPPGEWDKTLPSQGMGELSRVLAARPIPAVPGGAGASPRILRRRGARKIRQGRGAGGARKWERPGPSPALLLPQPHLPGPLNIPWASPGATSVSPARCPHSAPCRATSAVSTLSSVPGHQRVPNVSPARPQPRMLRLLLLCGALGCGAEQAGEPGTPGCLGTPGSAWGHPGDRAVADVPFLPQPRSPSPCSS